MKKINPESIGKYRRSPEFKRNFSRFNHNIKLFSLAVETQNYWDELNAKLFFMKIELIESLSALNPSTKEYKSVKENLKKVELLYKEVRLQIDFTYSFSGKGDNPFALEEEWINRPWDQKPWDEF